MLVTLLAASTLATTLLMVRFMFLLWARRRREIIPLPRVPFSVWLCLVALITVLPFLLAGIDRLMINMVPVSLGLLLGLVAIKVGARVYPLLISNPIRTGIRGRYSCLSTALRDASRKAHVDSRLPATVRTRS